MIVPKDILCGTREIACFLRVNQMRALRLLRSDRIPGQLLRGRWYARQRDLEAYRHEARP